MLKIHPEPVDMNPIQRISSISWLYALLFLLALAAPPTDAAAVKEDYETLYDRARQAAKKNMYADAINLYKKANELKGKTSLECLLGMAEVYNKSRNYDEAVKACDQLIQLSGNDIGFLVKAWNLRGNVLFNSSIFNRLSLDKSALQKSEAAFREVLKIAPGLNMAHYNLGLVMIRLKRVDEGIAELQIYLKNADEKDVAERARKIIENPKRVDENCAPDFSLVTADGDYINSDQSRGKVILLDFWAIRNNLSMQAIPYLTNLALKYQNEAFLPISINYVDEEPQWRTFIDQNKLNWKHVRDKNNKLKSDFQIYNFPTYILIDHEGLIRYRGSETSSQIEKELKKALKDATAFNLQPRFAPAPPVQTGSAPPPNPARAAGPIVKTDYVIKIPKPVLKVEFETPPAQSSRPAQPASIVNDLYRVQIRNWASMPDDLFMQVKDLPPCTGGSSGAVTFSSSSGATIPTRIEVTFWNEQGMRLNTLCGPARPEFLERTILVVPRKSNSTNIYLIIKDRLNGNSVQSDTVPLP
jgi:tetratricopeptide (TPR) repeat protein